MNCVAWEDEAEEYLPPGGQTGECGPFAAQAGSSSAHTCTKLSIKMTETKLVIGGE
jgi:hypothetical protein